MIEINAIAKKNLNEQQILFTEYAYKRISFIQDNFDFEAVPAPIRLLYFKELYTIFNELNRLPFKKHISTPTIEPIEGASAFNDLKETLTFIRNVFNHFPIFDTWDDVWISKNFTAGLDGHTRGRIYGYLENCKGRIPMAFQLTLTGGLFKQITVNYPQDIDENDRVYIRDILSEKDGAFALIQIMHKFL